MRKSNGNAFQSKMNGTIKIRKEATYIQLQKLALKTVISTLTILVNTEVLFLVLTSTQIRLSPSIQVKV